MDEFTIPYIHGKDVKDERPRPAFVGRGTRGMSVIYLYSKDFTKIGTTYGSRYANRKPFGGGIEELDTPEKMADAHEADRVVRAMNPYDDPAIAAAYNCAARELREESGICWEDLELYPVNGIESPFILLEDVMEFIGDNPARGRRYYFVAHMKEDLELHRFGAQEDSQSGQSNYVDKQAWTPVLEMLDGGYNPDEPFNTIYCAATPRVLEEMNCRECFHGDSTFQDLFAYDLRGVDLAEKKAKLYARVAEENKLRAERRNKN